MTYYSERLQEARYSISQEELREYFPLPRVLEGLFGVIERLFQVKIAPRDGVAVWHPDARYYDIHDMQGEPVAASSWTSTPVRISAAAPGWMTALAARRPHLAHPFQSHILSATRCLVQQASLHYLHTTTW